MRTKQWWKIATLFLFVVGGAAGVLLLRHSQELWSDASYQPATIQVDAQAVIGPLPRPWANYAQGGEDHEWRIGELSSQVRALRPEYIRLDHIYDFYDIVGGTSGNLTFDFSKLDLVLDDIAAVGAKPYIALSYTPTQLSDDGSIVGKPTNYVDWQVIVQRTIQHISGTRRTAGVYYEVWNEPDLFGGWKYSGGKNYLDLYGAAARGAANARGVQPFKLGGPATTALYKNWVVALAQYVQKNNYRLDFISWHRYSHDVNVYRKDMSDIRQWTNDLNPPLPNTVEYHITEWGHDSDVHPGYDTTYGAAHSVAGALEMIGVLERAFVFEIQDGKDPQGKANWGRWGLFTHSSHGSSAKPRYRALLMLEQLGRERLQLLGKGTYVKAVATRTNTNEIKIALVNFDPKGSNTENVPITLKNAPMNQTSVTVTYLSRPATNKTATTTEDGTGLTTTILMQPQDVAIVTFKITN